MQHFEIGLISFIFALAFPILYFASYQIRRLGAWSKREAKPGDRVGFFLLIALIFGFIVGSLAQPLWQKSITCQAAGQPVVPCVLKLNHHG